jgi:hypothetical protein
MKFLESYRTGTAIVVYLDILGFSSLMHINGPADTIAKLLDVWKQMKDFYSDSVFISYILKKKKEDTLNNCFEDLEVIYDIYFKMDFFLRGGISCGIINYTNNLIVGEPVVSAVKYESELNPGPIIIFPTIEYKKIYDHATFSPIKKSIQIETKDPQGMMDCFAIIPRDVNNYIYKIKSLQTHYAQDGHYQLALYWLKQLNFINQYNEK